MRGWCKGLLLGELILCAAGANATLIDNGDGTVTDTSTGLMWSQKSYPSFSLTASDFNNIIADVGSVAGHTLTSSDFSPGIMDWWGAMAFAQDLSFAGYSDWRLPSVTDTGSPGCDGSFGGTDCGFNVDPATGELARLFEVSLGNPSDFTPSGTATGCGLVVDCMMNQGPFSVINFPSLHYWTNTEYALDASQAWYFSLYEGIQSPQTKTTGDAAWVVRTVTAVPAPGTITLVGLGFAVLISSGRKRS